MTGNEEERNHGLRQEFPGFKDTQMQGNRILWVRTDGSCNPTDRGLPPDRRLYVKGENVLLAQSFLSLLN